jgi:hypothetical protein
MLYRPCLFLAPAGDDWLLITPVREMLAERGFAGALAGAFTLAIDQFYRPLALLPHLFTIHTMFWVQLAKLLMVIVLAFLVRQTARELGLSGWGASVAALLTLFHPVFVSVVTEVDLWGDVLAAIALVLLVWVAQRFGNGRARGWLYIVAVGVITAMGLLSKEAGVACFVTPVVFALLSTRGAIGQRRQHILAAAVSLLLTGLYWWWRSYLGIHSTGAEAGGYYSLHFGLNVLKNVMLAVIALVSPVNTVEVALGPPVWRIAAASWLMLFFVLVTITIVTTRQRGNWRKIIGLAVLFFAAQGPVLLMPHLTEANFSRSVGLGWLALLLTFEPLVQRVRSRAAVWGLVGVMLIWLGLGTTAICSKVADIVYSQDRAERFRAQLYGLMPKPPDRPILFAIEDPGYSGYSVYRQPLWVDLRDGEIPYGLKNLYGNSRFEAEYILVPTGTSRYAVQADFWIDRFGQLNRLR